MQATLQTLRDSFEASQTCLVEPFGTLLLGPTPHKGKDCWFHELFRPLQEEEIGGLEDRVGKPFPAEYRSFLRLANGLRLFSDELALFGLRDNHGRTGDAIWQPYDLVDPNRLEKPCFLPSEALVIGAYSYDGSLLAMGEGGVCLYDREQEAPPKASWPSLECFLSQEYRRLQSFFDEKHRLKDPEACTLPGSFSA